MSDVEAFYRDLPEDDLLRPITESAVEGEQDWSAKDHLAHLAQVETTFRGVVERALAGDPDPAEMGQVKSAQEAISRQNHVNAQTVVEGRAHGLPELLARLRAARAQTLQLMEACTDEQLASPVPGAPWGDGSIAGVLATVAGHHGRHLMQVQNGLEANRDG
ncbi:MAG: hypothetical protein QOK05_473 [Chloroflexota bacterium]|jgi:uncharacterized damage-inducible protein DinB|nr:hypothetical protein [Chloroflexota bacterium]